MTKAWYRSTTIWLNIAGGAAIIIQLMLNQQIVPTQYQELAMVILNILNRFRTETKIG